MLFKDCHQVMALLKHSKEMERIQVQSSYVNSYHLSSAVTEKLPGIQGTRCGVDVTASSWKETVPHVDSSRRLIIWLDVQ